MITVTTLEESKKYQIKHYTGNTEFPGCQCYTNCLCKEDFKSEVINEYSITIYNLTSKRPKSKTKRYNTLEECYEHLTNI